MNPTVLTKKNGGFDPDTFLATIGDGRKILIVPKKQLIFSQGDDADAVFYVQKGKVRLYRCISDWQGSYDRHREPGELLW